MTIIIPSSKTLERPEVNILNNNIYKGVVFNKEKTTYNYKNIGSDSITFYESKPLATIVDDSFYYPIKTDTFRSEFGFTTESTPSLEFIDTYNLGGVQSAMYKVLNLNIGVYDRVEVGELGVGVIGASPLNISYTDNSSYSTTVFSNLPDSIFLNEPRVSKTKESFNSALSREVFDSLFTGNIGNNGDEVVSGNYYSTVTGRSYVVINIGEKVNTVTVAEDNGTVSFYIFLSIGHYFIGHMSSSLGLITFNYTLSLYMKDLNAEGQDPQNKLIEPFFEHPSNELLQDGLLYSNLDYYTVISEHISHFYSKGKATARLKVAYSEYKDENDNVVYTGKDGKIIKVGDIIEPYYYAKTSDSPETYGDVPLLTDANGNPKKFLVTGSEINAGKSIYVNLDVVEIT